MLQTNLHNCRENKFIYWAIKCDQNYVNRFGGWNYCISIIEMLLRYVNNKVLIPFTFWIIRYVFTCGAISCKFFLNELFEFFRNGLKVKINSVSIFEYVHLNNDRRNYFELIIFVHSLEYLLKNANQIKNRPKILKTDRRAKTTNFCQSFAKKLSLSAPLTLRHTL
jgi:hypothetical protein